MTILTFEAALSAANGKKHLLLGNGFSIALKPDIFTYGSLYENRAIKRKSELLATERAGRAPTRPLSVSFYTAESAQVWG